MPKKVRMLLIGDAELRGKLSALTDAEARKAVLGATREAAKLIMAEVKRTIPKRTGLLRKSVKVRAIKRSRKRIGVRVTTSKFNSNYQGKAFYGAFLEFGWKTGSRRVSSPKVGEKPQPVKERKQVPPKEFIKKATDRKKDEALAMFRTKIDDHIRKVIGKRK